MHVIMAKVQSTRAKLYETKSTVADEPTEHVESAGDRLIKELVTKQLDKNITLEEQLQDKKHFEKASEYCPFTNLTSGKSSLKQFEETAKKAAHIEDLKSFGLSNEEVEMALDYELGEDHFSQKYKKVEKSILSSQLLLIHSKINNGLNEREQEVEKRLSVGRHEQELSLSVKPESLHTRLLQFALSCKATISDPRPGNHPIHHLKELEEELFGSLRKRRKKEKITYPQKSSAPSAVENSHCHYNYDHHSTLWDVKESPMGKEDCKNAKKNTKQINETRVYTCKPETLYTIKDGKIVQLNALPKHKTDMKEKDTCGGQAFVLSDVNSSEVQVVSLSEIQNNRLNLEQIKQLPRFQNYDRGLPSPVLFLKNLPGCVKESDLVSIFNLFESSEDKRIIYRLMTGRMKGQAFITFPTTDMATKALETVNGYVLKGKPIIIQYGKSCPTV
ncbi:RNA-binding protein 41-like isoform X1 [Schistocerca americana]|uniref:RNA-binding protein 41-like isoform X1 n=2 Tax=Schistocerca americana TaxID=7009 RepID=UPI001F4F1353|nr:RNA-binding protein 41-like isoform X1 [Schistocerca americana]